MIKKFFLYHSIHKKIVPLLDFVFLIRPTFHFFIWAVIISGMISMNLTINQDFYWDLNFSISTILIFLSLTILIGSAFIIIQSDVRGKINKSLLEEVFFSFEIRSIISNRLLIISIILLIFVNWILIVPSLCIFYLLGISYKSKPLNWHFNPFISIFVLSLISILLYIVGCLIVFKSDQISMCKIISFKFLFSFISYIFTFISIIFIIILDDYKNEYSLIKKQNSNSLNITLFSVSPLILLFISLTLSFLLNDPLLSTAIIVFLPFFIFVAIRGLNKDIKRAIKYPVFIFNFFILSYYPWFSIPLLFVFYLSKYYYWHRFGWHYPTFLVDD